MISAMIFKQFKDVVERIYQIDIVDSLTQNFLTISFLLMAFTLNGDWLIFSVNIMRQFGWIKIDDIPEEEVSNFLNSIHLKNYPYFWLMAIVAGYGIYFTFGGLFHWYYYVMQKDNPEKWKCQPQRWLSRDLELDEIKTGCISLLITNTWSSLLSCYIHNRGRCTVYYRINEYGIVWFILQWPVVFIYQDYVTYWMHRWLHTPYLYNRFHKSHHKYQQPTAFSAVAIHPVEVSFMQMVLVMPLFVIPVHWVSFSAVALYVYYHGLVIHSGIIFKAKWWQPWQPDSLFHDNHHQYYHVNYGFNCFWWDILHDTYRKADRIYNEDIFYGGKSIAEVSEEDLQKEIEERRTETITAYEGNENPYLTELINITKKKNS